MCPIFRYSSAPLCPSPPKGAIKMKTVFFKGTPATRCQLASDSLLSRTIAIFLRLFREPQKLDLDFFHFWPSGGEKWAATVNKSWKRRTVPQIGRSMYQHLDLWTRCVQGYMTQEDSWEHPLLQSKLSHRAFWCCTLKTALKLPQIDQNNCEC